MELHLPVAVWQGNAKAARGEIDTCFQRANNICVALRSKGSSVKAHRIADMAWM